MSDHKPPSLNTQQQTADTQREYNPCDMPTVVTIQNILPTSTDLQLRAHLTATKNYPAASEPPKLSAHLTLGVTTFCLHSVWSLLISSVAPQQSFHRRHEQLSPSAPWYFMGLSYLVPRLKTHHRSCSLHSSNYSTSLITLTAFSGGFFP